MQRSRQMGTNKKNNKADNKKTMDDYRNRQKRLNLGGKVMAIILILSMVIFYVITTAIELFN